MTPVCADNLTRSVFAMPTNVGVSTSANEIKKQETGFLQQMLGQSMTIGKLYRQTLVNIEEACEQAAADNWDGYGAKAVNGRTYLVAIRFLMLLPPESPVPEISIDTDGEVSFDWYRGPRQVFSVTIRGNGELAYAGLFGASKTHGTEYLNDELPDAILDNMYRVYPKGVHLATF